MRLQQEKGGLGAPDRVSEHGKEDECGNDQQRRVRDRRPGARGCWGGVRDAPGGRIHRHHLRAARGAQALLSGWRGPRTKRLARDPAPPPMEHQRDASTRHRCGFAISRGGCDVAATADVVVVIRIARRGERRTPQLCRKQRPILCKIQRRARESGHTYVFPSVRRAWLLLLSPSLSLYLSLCDTPSKLTPSTHMHARAHTRTVPTRLLMYILHGEGPKSVAQLWDRIEVRNFFPVRPHTSALVCACVCACVCVAPDCT